MRRTLIACLSLLAACAPELPLDENESALDVLIPPIQLPAPLDVPMVLDVSNASIVSEYTVDLPANTPATFLTTNLSDGSDPVLHLLDANGQEVAAADNGGLGLAARLTYTPPTSG